MNFFFDTNLSEHLARGLQAFGENVIHLKEIFPESTEDVVWLQYIGQNNLTLVTRDEHVRWNPFEILAIRRHKVGAFFLGGKNLTRCRIIQQVVRNWPQIKIKTRNTIPPYIYRIPPSGTKFTRIAL